MGKRWREGEGRREMEGGRGECLPAWKHVCDHTHLVTMQDRAKQDAEVKKMRLRHHKEVRRALVAEKLQSDHKKHYHICRDVLLSIVDLSTKISEYRELTEKYMHIVMSCAHLRVCLSPISEWYQPS